MTIKKILCIEDDRFIGEMYVRSLKRAGYDVEWITDGDRALVELSKNTYDLVLLDIMLPELSGTEILKKLREKDVADHTHTLTLVMTNFDQDDESRAAMELKADAYLIKAEITPRKLLEVITHFNSLSTDE